MPFLDAATVGDGWPALVAAAVYVFNPILWPWSTSRASSPLSFCSASCRGCCGRQIAALSGRRAWLVGLASAGRSDDLDASGAGAGLGRRSGSAWANATGAGMERRPPQQRACRHTGGAASRRAALASRAPEPWIWRRRGRCRPQPGLRSRSRGWRCSPARSRRVWPHCLSRARLRCAPSWRRASSRWSCWWRIRRRGRSRSRRPSRLRRWPFSGRTNSRS